jgi:hypothetical protein
MELLLLYELPLLYPGDCKLRPAIFPGRVWLVFGVRARRGRSVGGRGAGPGFMNWSREYILRNPGVSSGIKSALGKWRKHGVRPIRGDARRLVPVTTVRDRFGRN